MPFNAILVSGKNIQVDESSMTGETLKVDKNELTDDSNESNCFLISNTSIIQGSGEAVVCSFDIKIQSDSSEAINESTSSYDEKLGKFLEKGHPYWIYLSHDYHNLNDGIPSNS